MFSRLARVWALWWKPSSKAFYVFIFLVLKYALSILFFWVLNHFKESGPLLPQQKLMLLARLGCVTFAYFYISEICFNIFIISCDLLFFSKMNLIATISWYYIGTDYTYPFCFNNFLWSMLPSSEARLLHLPPTPPSMTHQIILLPDVSGWRSLKGTTSRTWTDAYQA